jgi:hypothetical protein
MEKRLIWFAGFLVAVSGLCGCSESSYSSPALATEPAKVYFMSVTATPLANESIMIRNNSGDGVDVSGWTLGDAKTPSAYAIPAGTVIEQGGTRTYPHYVLGFQIDDSGETLYLKDNAGADVDQWTN